MNKGKFLNLLTKPGKIQDKSLIALEELAEEYPYCQAVHLLIAKGYHSLSKENFEGKLNHAAVYAADRRHLKHIIEDNTDESMPSDVDEGHYKAQKNAVSGSDSETFSEDFLKKGIESYLEKLRKEKTSLELQGEEGLSEELVREKAIFKKELEVKIAEAEAKLARIQGLVKPKKPKKEKQRKVDNADAPEAETIKIGDNEAFYSELEKNLQALQAHKEKVFHPAKNQEVSGENKNLSESSQPISPLSNNIEKERMEEYLASLKASEQKLIENDKVREQIKLINEFIENEPKLSRLELADIEDEKEKRVDLSLKSLKATANIASENLALIMVKQGKLEKAEEIYHKLIWKFPEKKAYFVARIEELKKK